MARVGAQRTSQQGNMCTQHMLLHTRSMCIATSFGARKVRVSKASDM